VRRGTPLARSTMRPRHTAMRPSPETVQLVIDRDYRCCALCGLECFGTRSLDWSVQHRRPAKSGGDTRPESHQAGNLVLLHGSGTTHCHGRVESERTWAEGRGLLVREPKAPALMPVLHLVHNGWVLLDNAGRREQTNAPAGYAETET
jgi:hypothetical protein